MSTCMFMRTTLTARLCKLHYLTMTLRPVNSSVGISGPRITLMLLRCPVLSWITPWELTILKVTGPIKPEHHVQHSWWKAKFHALHRLFHASPGETPMRGSCLSARFAPAFDGIATIWLPKSPIIREESEQNWTNRMIGMWNFTNSRPQPPTRLQPISFNAGSEGDLTSAGNQHSWRSVNNAGSCIVSLCHVRLSVESGNLSNISEYFFGHCGKKSHNPLELRQKIQLWQVDYVCGNFLASRLVQPKQKATTPTPKLRQLCPGSPPVNDPSELVVPLTLFVFVF